MRGETARMPGPVKFFIGKTKNKTKLKSRRDGLGGAAPVMQALSPPTNHGVKKYRYCRGAGLAAIVHIMALDGCFCVPSGQKIAI